eukprot:TRINITY_DN3912_c0_g1_i17.p1 TRINITY_DN3912_c0_g1~~TRINITY_DN3912_c0_g1_i17.p1  ORF type:complete len:225 (-),score=33.16 TRINITY_DN3912_c0_g1_i17:709-1383(-)
MFPTTTDFIVDPPCTDSVSSLCWHPNAINPNQSQFLVAGSWDKQVRLWEVKPNGQTEGRASVSHEAPVLSVCFHANYVFSGGCDNKVLCWDVQANAKMLFGSHDAPVKYVQWINDKNVLLTGSWDKTLRYWDGRSPTATGIVSLPERLYAADVGGNTVVVGTAERKVLVYDLRNPSTVAQQLESPLKFQTRCISLFNDFKGFAIGSIEGRVALHHLESSQSSYV